MYVAIFLNWQINLKCAYLNSNDSLFLATVSLKLPSSVLKTAETKAAGLKAVHLKKTRFSVNSKERSIARPL